MAKKTYSKPSKVVAEDERVLVDGPDHVDIAMTPEAALETSERLLQQGLRATGQRRANKLDHRPKGSEH